MRPKLARLAASTGNVGRMPENVSLASAAAPGAACSTERTCGSALATSVVNRASPSASDRCRRRADLGVQERAGLIDQLRGLPVAGVGLVDQRPRRLDQPRQFGPGAVERLERFAQQILEPAVAEAAHQLVGLAQHPGDVLADRGVLARRCWTRCAAAGLRRIVRRHQVDVLLADRGDTLDRGGDVLRHRVVLLSRMCAATPSSVSPTASTRPTFTPR